MELFQEKNKVFNEYKKKKREKLLEELGLTADGELISPSLFKERLIKAFNVRLLPDNFIEGINVVMDSPHKLFDTLIVKKEIESVMMSLFKNDVINTKVNGGFYVQESSSGYELFKKSNHLKFYRQDEKGNTLPMEVNMTLPKTYKNFVKKKYGTVENFNKAIKGTIDGTIEEKNRVPEELFTFTGNRTPAQGMNSLEVMQVTRFFPPHVGKRLVLPAEIVVKTGS